MQSRKIFSMAVFLPVVAVVLQAPPSIVSASEVITFQRNNYPTTSYNGVFDNNVSPTATSTPAAQKVYAQMNYSTAGERYVCRFEREEVLRLLQLIDNHLKIWKSAGQSIAPQTLTTTRQLYEALGYQVKSALAQQHLDERLRNTALDLTQSITAAISAFSAQIHPTTPPHERF
jgi:hypothetical protein